MLTLVLILLAGLAISFAIGCFIYELGIIIAAVVFVIGLAGISTYYSCQVKVEIINEEFGTNYTASEYFWAADVLDEVREMQRLRVELIERK